MHRHHWGYSIWAFLNLLLIVYFRKLYIEYTPGVGTLLVPMEEACGLSQFTVLGKATVLAPQFGL